MATRQQTLVMIMLVALAFATSTMTALRAPGIPVGLAELILIGCMIVHIPLGNGVHGGNLPNRFVPFLFAMLVAMLPGYFVTLTTEGQVPSALYNLIASVWVVLLFAYLHFGFDHGRGEIDMLARLFLLFSSVYFGAVLLLSVFDPAMVYLQDDIETLRLDGPGDEEGEGPVFRLVGFSTNPNQLALHSLVCAFFALELWKRNGFFLSVVCLGLAIAAGLMAQSDAFLFSAIALIGIWVTMGIVFNRSVVLGLVIIVPAVTAIALSIGPIVRDIQEVANARDQGDTRFTLWENGIAAGLERPFFGLGPGAWSGFEGPRGLEEAHNSAIDYFSNAGLLGITVLAIGVVVLLWRAFAAKEAAMLAGVVAILMFAAFHNVLRQPIMWLGLYYIAQRVWPGARTSAVRRRGRRRARRTAGPGLPI